MLHRAARLVAELCLAYDVPAKKLSAGQLKAGQNGLCGHADVRDAWGETTHWDPGPTSPGSSSSATCRTRSTRSIGGHRPPVHPRPDTARKETPMNRVQHARLLTGQALSLPRAANYLLRDVDPDRTAVGHMEQEWTAAYHQIADAYTKGPEA